MINILFVSHDPGGANLLLPIIDDFSKCGTFNIYLALIGSAFEKIKLKKSNITYLNLETVIIKDFPNEKNIDELDVKKVFIENKIEIVFTSTSTNSNIEKLFLKHGRINNIKTFSIIDFWASYVRRFKYIDEMILPDIIFVTDNKMKEDLYQSIPNLLSLVIVSGNPYLENIIKDITLKEKKVNINKIRFFSENIHHYYKDRKINEFNIVKNILSFLEKTENKYDFIIRTHPMESKEKWITFITNNHFTNINMSIDNLTLKEVLEDNFVSIGISSMVLLETAIYRIPTYSYQINLDKDEYLFLPFDEYFIKAIKNYDELKFLSDQTNICDNKIKELSSLKIIKESIDRLF